LKQITFIFLLLSSFFTKAQDEPLRISNLNGYIGENIIKVNYLTVKVQSINPNKVEIPMGTIGVHYDFTINKHFYAGMGMFAAVDGDQGGLFTLGAEIGFQQHLLGNVYLDTDIHFGGGGGYRYLVKDGGFINYNIGLKYNTSKLSLGLQYSYFNFYNGYIKSSGISGFVSIPTKLIFTDYEKANKEFVLDKNNSDYFWNRSASKNGLSLRFDHFFPIGATKNEFNVPIDNVLYLLGFEYDHYINRKTFSYIHMDAMYKGLESGFMDMFLGIGYEPIQTKSLKVFAKIGAGASGGRVEREGGLSIYPNIGLEKTIHKNISVTFHSGYMAAPFGNFEAYTLGYGIKYNTYDNGTFHTDFKDEVRIKTHGIRVSLQNQTYYKAASKDNIDRDLQLLVLQINEDFSEHLYITGQAAFTYEGEAGGYADGMIGFGYYAPRIINRKIEFNLETLVGVCGGAGISTGSGIASKTKLGFNYFLSPKFNIHTSIGKMIAPKGRLNSTILSFGFSFNLAKLRLQHKNS
jgi:hypothetical protein